MAKITRRRFLYGAASLAAAAAGGAGLLHGRRLLPRLRRAASPRLPDAAPGPLSRRLRTTLLAAVEALLPAADGAAGRPRAVAPYAGMLAARAEEIAGYRELYRRFAAAADRRAAAAGAPSFAAAPRPLRRRVLADLCPAGRLARLRLGLTDPDRARFRLYLVQEVLDLYAATGAWRALGYAAHPGEVRGLDAYTGPPPDGAAAGEAG
jgi:hypothetical protein